MRTRTPLSSIIITETPVATLTPLPRPPYDFIVLHAPPSEMMLPELMVADDGTLDLTREKGTSSEYSRGILDTNSGCFVDTVTATYSPDHQYITIAKRCIASEGHESVYLVHSDGTGLMRTIVGYDGYESGTNRPIEWAPNSKSFIYFRAPGFSDAHLEIFAGIFRYDVETAERKFLTRLWGEYKWSLDGKWIAVLETNLHTECRILYVLDSQEKGLWELEKFCEYSNVDIEFLWHRDEKSNEMLVVKQKERNTQNTLFQKEYKPANLSNDIRIPIK